MKKVKKRYVAMTLLVLGVYAVVLRFQSRFIVENQTSQTIKQVQVEVCDQTYTLYDIPAGGKAWSRYSMGGDSGYGVLAELQNGTKLEGGGGYVTNGYFGMRDRIIIQNNGQIDVKQSDSLP